MSAGRWVPNDRFGEPELCPKCGKQTESLEDDEMTYGERCRPCGWTIMFPDMEDDEADYDVAWA